MYVCMYVYMYTCIHVCVYELYAYLHISLSTSAMQNCSAVIVCMIDISTLTQKEPHLQVYMLVCVYTNSHIIHTHTQTS
jgi:hypothetical protein